MYHYITLGNLTLHMTGIGVIVFLGVFLWSLYLYTKKHELSIHPFVAFIPFYIVLIYVFGAYVHYLIEENIIFTIHRKQVLRYLSPYGYHFHSIGISIAAIVGGYKYLKNIPNEEKKNLRINGFFESLAWASIPFGLFLVLGDSFIGLPTDGSFYISAIRSDSLVAVFDKVIPLGLLISIVGLILGGGSYIFSTALPKNYGLLGIAMYSFSFAIITIFQEYPRRLVMGIGEYSIDIKQYFFITITVFFIGLWIHRKNKA